MEPESTVREIPLLGGRLTEGVVRVGDTVRRPATPASKFVSLLLGHLEKRGFSGAPRYLGLDERNRDTLTYIPGWVPAKFQYFSDDQIRAAGRLLRALHDATRNSDLIGPNSVVCHHDAGPNNVVFQDGMPMAFIDFDMAAPGEPMEDLGYMAWAWCVSSKKTRPPVGMQAAQVRILLESYGVGARDYRSVFDAMLARQSLNIEFWLERRALRAGTHPGRDGVEKIDEVLEWSRLERAYTQLNKSAFLAALT